MASCVCENIVSSLKLFRSRDKALLELQSQTLDINMVKQQGFASTLILNSRSQPNKIYRSLQTGYQAMAGPRKAQPREM